MNLKVGSIYSIKLTYEDGNPDLVELFKKHEVLVKVISVDGEDDVANIEWIKIPEVIAAFYQPEEEDEEGFFDNPNRLSIDCFSWVEKRKSMINK